MTDCSGAGHPAEDYLMVGRYAPPRMGSRLRGNDGVVTAHLAGDGFPPRIVVRGRLCAGMTEVGDLGSTSSLVTAGIWAIALWAEWLRLLEATGRTCHASSLPPG